MKPYYQDEWVTIYHGDCREILPELPKVDLVLTDPPYSSGGMMRGDRVIKSSRSKYIGDTNMTYPDFSGDTMDQRAWTLWATLVFGQIRGAMKPSAVFGSFIDWRQLPALTDAIQMAGLVWRGTLSWNKKGGRPTLGRFRQQTEFIVWGSNGEMSLEGPCPPGHFDCSVGGSQKLHMTEKPIGVLKWLLQIAWRGEENILDPFMGSGTTLFAAKQLNRKCIGIEIEEKYCEIAAKRCSQGVFNLG